MLIVDGLLSMIDCDGRDGLISLVDCCGRDGLIYVVDCDDRRDGLLYLIEIIIDRLKVAWLVISIDHTQH